MDFEFATATRILFGPGRLGEIGSLAAPMGHCALLVTGRQTERAAGLAAMLMAKGVGTMPMTISCEPDVATVLAGVQAARKQGCDLVIACGGGSVLDTGKAIAGLMTNPGDPMDYLEIVGRALPLVRPSLPCICIPTTAGTGCEVTRNSVLSAPEHRVKVSLRSPLLLPRLAIVDPLLTHSLPPALTASTGLDALTQLIEAFVCCFANPMTDALCRDGIRRVGLSLRRAWKNGDDAWAREEMALASLFGGLALANARLGAVHGLAGPLGGMFPAPHGVVCARLLPVVMQANLTALHARKPEAPALVRYEEIGRLLTGQHEASAEQGVEWVQALCDDLTIPPLKNFGVDRGAFPALVTQAGKSSSMKGNPIPLTPEELTHILEQAL